jgi:hypothetical protein
MFNVQMPDGDETEVKTSVVVRLFINKQVLVTITDTDRFGSTFSAKKVKSDFDEFDLLDLDDPSSAEQPEFVVLP